MARAANNRPAEIFGYPPDNPTVEALEARQKHWCPFVNQECNKKSRLLPHPLGVCSVEHHSEYHTTCPRRFQQSGKFTGLPRPLEDIAKHYFSDFNNLVSFPEVKLPRIGSVDYVLVKHKPLRAEVEDFIMVEFQSDSTTGTGEIVKAVRDFFAGHELSDNKYKFGLNTYDTLKRSMTQLLNKGIVYEKWDIKGYWVIQEYIYANLVRRYGFKREGYTSGHASRFALYDLRRKRNRLSLEPTRFISTTVEEVYQAMRTNPSIPGKDAFVETLTDKLRAKLSLEWK